MAEGRKKERGIVEEAQIVLVSQKKQQIVTQIAVLQLQLQVLQVLQCWYNYLVIISALFVLTFSFAYENYIKLGQVNCAKLRYSGYEKALDRWKISFGG